MPLFLLQNVQQTTPDQLWIEWLEAETSAARLQRRNDLRDIVADETEARVLRVFLDDCMKEKMKSYFDEEQTEQHLSCCLPRRELPV